MKLNGVQRAERLRKQLGLSFEQFSHHIGLTSTAYYRAYRRGRLSPGMAAMISMKCKVPLEELR